MRIKQTTQIKTIIKVIEIVMTMMIIAVQTFLQRIGSSTDNQSNENQTQTYSENSSAEQSDNGEEQLRLIQMNQIIVQTN